MADHPPPFFADDIFVDNALFPPAPTREQIFEALLLTSSSMNMHPTTDRIHRCARGDKDNEVKYELLRLQGASEGRLWTTSEVNGVVHYVCQVGGCRRSFRKFYDGIGSHIVNSHCGIRPWTCWW